MSESASTPADEPDAGEPNSIVENTNIQPIAARPFLPNSLLAVGLIAAVVIGVAQWLPPWLDYQYANLFTMVATLIFVVYGLFVLQRAASSRGQRFVVPIGTLATIGVFFTLFRHDGYSGETWPLFSWRFASQQHAPLQEAPLIETTNDAIDAADAAEKTEAIALADSAQFLGPNRNGVVKDRLFAIPKTDADVKVLWNQSIGDGWASFAVHHDRAVTLEQRDDQECVTCYRLSDGKLLWIDQHPARHEQALGGVGPRSTPTITNGKVFAMGALGFLRALDLETGERVWTKDFLDEAGWTVEEFAAAAPWGHASSPLLIPSDDGLSPTLVLGFGGPVDPNAVDNDGMTPTAKSLIALGTATGETRWKAGQDQFSYASPMLMTLAGTPQIVSVNEKTISGHDVQTGYVLWSHPWPGQTNSAANCAAAIPIPGDRFVIGKGYSGGSAVVKVNRAAADDWLVESEWSSNRVLQTKFNHTVVAGDIGFGLNNGTLQAVDLNTGDSKWMQSRRERFGQGQLLLVGDVLISQTESGDVVFVAADANEYRELGRLDALNSKTWNIPTIAGRHLIVRNDRQTICYLLPAK
ncbi:MAG: PQQ-binding-like beta-propeller repeat protein [Pirellulaceae bacterium]